MATSIKLLAEQAWTLRLNLKRCIETANIKPVPSFRLARLNIVEERAYSRYVRRLKKWWE